MKTYFAMFLPAKEGGYSIFFPDFPEIATQGSDLAECLYMAADALKATIEDMLENREGLPEPSSYDEALEAMRKETAEAAGLDASRKPLLQLVPAPAIDETPVRISVSMTRGELENLDRAARARGLTRSGYIARAARAFA